LASPGAVFDGQPGVTGWHPMAAGDGTPDDGPGTYEVAVSDAAVAAPAITRALVSAGADVLSIAESRRSLQDVYLELVDEDVEAAAR
jgi:ABC-2 type transport system ATP-binding protein